ncbi:MAG: type I secretion system permease/ATPase [Peptostreptococcaceae bacterium]|nr:type I secretion system permease/ATPase [Peptostreptococcaceae bacterium]
MKPDFKDPKNRREAPVKEPFPEREEAKERKEKETENTKDRKSAESPADSALSCFVTIAAFHGIAAEEQQLRHAFAMTDKISETQMLLAAKKIGLKAKAVSIAAQDLSQMRLPAIAYLKDQSCLIAAKADEKSILVLFPYKDRPDLLSKEAFEQIFDGRILLFARRSRKNEAGRFGLSFFLPDIIKYKKPLLQVLLAAFTLQVLGLFSPMMTQVVIDKVLVHHSFTTLNVLTVGLFLIILFETLLSMARTYVFSHTTSRMDVLLGSRLFHHLFSLPFPYFEARRVGDTIARVRELETIRQFLTGAPLTLVLDLLFLVVYLAVMFFYSTSLTFLTLASLPLFIALSLIVTPLFKARLEERFYHGAMQQSYLVESVTGIQTIKAFALEPQIQNKWEDLLANYVHASFRTGILSGHAGALAQWIQKTFDLLILWLGAHLVIEQKISVGQLIAFRMLSGRVSSPVLRLVQMWQDFQQAGLSMQRLGDIFRTRPEPSVDSSKITLPPVKGDIRFEQVRFRYRPENSEVIRNLSFEIPAGTVVGIVGRSGSGKSTLSKLIQRLYLPESGKILIDGVDIALADPAWLRRQIGVVLQENFLFHASIRENIAVHDPAAPMEEIIRMAKIAGAHEFILELPHAYDTIVGENGTGLSGGQKQRIALARALLGDPKILILDEATSALDYESERVIQQNLKQICQGRTVLMIAHRLSTLKEAHRILALDQGTLVEYDTPQALLAGNGLYAHLHAQQERRAPTDD